MPLDKDKLKTDLVALFQAAFANNYEQAKVAEELAKVIEAFVKSADITGVVVDVKAPGGGGPSIGTGTQTNVVKLT